MVQAKYLYKMVHFFYYRLLAKFSFSANQCKDIVLLRYMYISTWISSFKKKL